MGALSQLHILLFHYLSHRSVFRRSRTTTRRRKEDDSDEEDESSPSESSEDDEQSSPSKGPDDSTSEEEVDVPEPEQREEKLGRGARTRAKVSEIPT